MVVAEGVRYLNRLHRFLGGSPCLVLCQATLLCMLGYESCLRAHKEWIIPLEEQALLVVLSV